MGGIFCIMVSGHTLNDEIRNILFSKAQEMFAEKKDYSLIKSDEDEYVFEITTEWKTSNLDGIRGYAFRSIVEWQGHNTIVDYIVRPSDIDVKDIRWMQPPPNPSLN